jgi:hypothetical protein
MRSIPGIDPVPPFALSKGPLFNTGKRPGTNFDFSTFEAMDRACGIVIDFAKYQS